MNKVLFLLNNSNNNNNNNNLIFMLPKIHVNMIKCALHESIIAEIPL